MSIWLAFCLICVIYLERETIDKIGRDIQARLKVEWMCFQIRKSIRKERWP